MTKALAILLILLVILMGCTVCPPGYKEENVRKWEKRHKFTASINDSCLRAWKLSASRKF